MAGNGIKPSDLALPNPTENAEAQLPSPQPLPPIPMQMPQAQPNAQPAPNQGSPMPSSPAPAEDNPFLADVQSAQGPASTDNPFMSDNNPFAADMQPSQEVMGGKEAALFSLADNDKERQRTAEKFYGKGAQVIKQGDTYVVSDTHGNTHAMPSGTLKSWLENPLANLGAQARLALDVGSAAGTDALALAGAPETAGGSLALMGASGAAGQATADAIKGIAGTYDKDTGEQLKNLASAGTLNMAFGGIAKGVTDSIAQKALNKAALSMSTADALPIVQKEAQAMLSAQKSLKDMGINMPSLQAAVTGNNKDLMELGKHSDTEAAKTLGQSVDAIFHKIADTVTGGAYSQAVRGEKTDATKMLALTIDKFQKGTGSDIGKYRADVLKVAGDKSFPVLNLQQAINDTASELGLVNGAGKFIPMSSQEINMNFADKTARKVVQTLNDNYAEIFNNSGTLPAKKVLGLYQDLQKAAGSAGGSQYAKDLWGLRKAAIDDFHDIGQKFLNVDPEKYGPAMKNYRTALDVADTFNNILNNDAITANTMVDQVFSKTNLAKSEAMQQVVSKLNPGLWKDMKALKFANIARNNLSNVSYDEAGNIVSAKMNYAGINKELQALGKDTVDVLFGSKDDFGKMLNLNSFLDRTQQALKASTTIEQKQNMIRKALATVTANTSEHAIRAISGLFINKEDAAKAFFANGADLENISKGLPPKQKEWLYEAAKRAGQEVSYVKHAIGQ